VTLTEALVALAIAVGLAGIILPVLPGSLLVVGAILVWALETGGTTAWLVFAVAVAFIALGTVVKYALPGRRLKERGVPSSTLAVGALVGFIGFFVIPVVGMFVGFVLGIYVAEHRRVGPHEAWPSTKHALRAVGFSILIELVAGVLAAVTWAAGVILT
jgi:uncharacterized protein YqgC (DUF456 family)